MERHPGRHRARAGRPYFVFLEHKRPVAHVEEARLAAHRQRARADDLHPRVLLRVVRGGDADAARVPVRRDRGETVHLRHDQAAEHGVVAVAAVEHVVARPALEQDPPPGVDLGVPLDVLQSQAGWDHGAFDIVVRRLRDLRQKF